MTLMITFKPVIIIRVVVGIIDAIAAWAAVTRQRHKRLGAMVVESVKRLLLASALWKLGWNGIFQLELGWVR
jgi:hypothetical protein